MPWLWVSGGKSCHRRRGRPPPSLVRAAAPASRCWTGARTRPARRVVNLFPGFLCRTLTSGSRRLWLVRGPRSGMKVRDRDGPLDSILSASPPLVSRPACLPALLITSLVRTLLWKARIFETPFQLSCHTAEGPGVGLG